MLLSAVSVLVVAQSSSEIPEGLTNNPVLCTVICHLVSKGVFRRVSLPTTYKIFRGKEALGLVFLLVLRVCHVSVISPMLQTPVSAADGNVVM